jgi:hypothetical protein
MQGKQNNLDELLAGLGYQPLNRTWAKAELLLGLGAAGVGVLLGVWAVSRPAADWGLAAGGLALWVLGAYLALAGHRSHLYQSGNERTAFLLGELRRLLERD